MDRETAICILLAILIAVAVTCWSVISGDWIRAEASMFDGVSPESRADGHGTAFKQDVQDTDAGYGNGGRTP